MYNEVARHAKLEADETASPGPQGEGIAIPVRPVCRPGAWYVHTLAWAGLKQASCATAGTQLLSLKSRDSRDSRESY